LVVPVVRACARAEPSTAVDSDEDAGPELDPVLRVTGRVEEIAR
jgi:hypothetical protein